MCENLWKTALGKEFALCAHFIRGIIIRRPLTCLCESIMYVITDLKKLPILSGRKRKHVLGRCNRESFNHRNGQQTGPGPILPTTVSHTNIQRYVQSAKMQKNRVHKFCIQNVKNYNKKARNEKIVLEWSVDRTRPYPTHRRQSLTLFLYIRTKLQNTHIHEIEITKKTQTCSANIKKDTIEET